MVSIIIKFSSHYYNISHWCIFLIPFFQTFTYTCANISTCKLKILSIRIFYFIFPTAILDGPLSSFITMLKKTLQFRFTFTQPFYLCIPYAAGSILIQKRLFYYSYILSNQNCLKWFSMKQTYILHMITFIMLYASNLKIGISLNIFFSFVDFLYYTDFLSIIYVGL